MKHLLVVILAIACLVVYAPPARACFCILPELSESFTDARSVFLGETVNIVQPKRLAENSPIIERAYTVKFKIIRSWKGIPAGASEFSILWLTNCYECLDLPRMNERYLVFATPIRDNKNWSLVTMCNRTVGIGSDSNLMNPEIDPERDMKALDVIIRRTFMFTPRTIGNAYNTSLDARLDSFFLN